MGDELMHVPVAPIKNPKSSAFSYVKKTRILPKPSFTKIAEREFERSNNETCSSPSSCEKTEIEDMLKDL